MINPRVRERVIQNVLARYVVHDRSVQSRSGVRQSVPHFFLNDVVRYWRTMASDYASKMWERQREGWGIRNIKLRFSRKLLLIWGLLAAFAADVFPAPELHRVENDNEYFLALANHIGTLTEVAPLELLAQVVLECGDNELAGAIFSSYNQFLSVLANPVSREALEKVPFEGALDEPAYAGLRDASHEFREGVTRLFFDVHPQLRDLIRKFGVF